MAISFGDKFESEKSQVIFEGKDVEEGGLVW